MSLTLNVLKILTILIVLTTSVCSANQPSYQVTLYVHLHPRGPPVHLCNGVIVQSRLVLTTASCVHFKFSSDNSPVVAIVPSMISIIGGSSTVYSEELTLQVDNIFVADNFNFTTGEHDLALLRLNGILPLDKRNDMSWITLADDEDYDGSCLANFYVRNPLKGEESYIQSEQLQLLDSEACGATYEYPSKREDDICSLYYLPAGFNCNAMETLQNYNGDRGTGLVCGNKLMGLLSTILPLQNKSDCIEKPIKAYYAAIVPHIGWIFDHIAEEELNMFNKGEQVSSSPYSGETNAFIEPHQTETSSTIAPLEPSNLTVSAESKAPYNAAGSYKENFKFLSIVFGIYLLVLVFNC
ncbi:trypsin eta-like [Cochliomyia hominivorax]